MPNKTQKEVHDRFREIQIDKKRFEEDAKRYSRLLAEEEYLKQYSEDNAHRWLVESSGQGED